MNTIETLNRLLQLHARSLAVYLAECLPWTGPTSQSKAAAVREIGQSQRELADRIAERIVALDGVPDLGEFPLSFTGLNDLSVDYLVSELIKNQRRAAQVAGECVAALREGPTEALSIAEEAHGAALGYLDRLVELAQPAGAAV
jgi:bacterioferritin (cytochrome b1)